jgi:hypothetical protein
VQYRRIALLVISLDEALGSGRSPNGDTADGRDIAPFALTDLLDAEPDGRDTTNW